MPKKLTEGEASVQKLCEQYEAESLRVVLSDYKAAITSITDAFNDRLVKYDKQIALDLSVTLKPLQRTTELPDYGEDYRTDV